MIVSELINELEHVKNTFGDIKVFLHWSDDTKATSTEQIYLETVIDDTGSELRIQSYPY